MEYKVDDTPKGITVGSKELTEEDRKKYKQKLLELIENRKKKNEGMKDES